MKKAIIIVAAVLVTLGIAVLVAAFALNGFKFMKFDNSELITETFSVDDAFTNIEVVSNVADVAFVRSEDGKCSVVCVEREQRKFEVKVENGTLKVRQEERKNWFADFTFFSFNRNHIFWKKISKFS